MSAFLQRGLLVLWTCLAAGLQARAQLLCERVLSSPLTNPYYFTSEALLKVQPDSLRLLGSYGPTAGNTYFVRQRMMRVGIRTCDTLPLPGATVPTPNANYLHDQRPACVTRRGEILTASTQQTGIIRPGEDSVRLRLTLLGRNGQVRWSRLVAPCLPQHWAQSLIEAPDGGFYAAGAGSLVRLDSLGRLLWCRTYRYVFGFSSPVYSRRGTLLFSVGYRLFQPVLFNGTGVFEVSQRGDSLGLHPVQPVGSTVAINSERDRCSAQITRPLRDGGLLFTGIADSSGFSVGDRPFLARFTSNLQVAWVRALPYRVLDRFTMTQPFELADGTLLVFVSSQNSGLGQPYWFYHFSAAGALVRRYAFTSLTLPPFDTFRGSGCLGSIQGVQPLKDSTFMLASTYRNSAQSLTYLAHLRVPGLPRVLDSSFFPLAARSGAALAPEALGPPYPNPATESVSFAYALPPATRAARLVLTDLLGRVVADVPLARPTGQATLPVPGLAAGFYIATLRVNGRLLASRKLAVAH